MCLSSPKNTTRALCESFKEKYTEAAGVFIYGDSSGNQGSTKTEFGVNDYSIIMKELSEYHPVSRVQNKNPRVAVRGNFINNIFSINYKGISMFIDDKCKHTVQDFLNVKEAPDGTKAKIRVKDTKSGISYERYGHTSDAIDYLITTLFMKEFMGFSKGGSGKLTTFRRPENQDYF